jgi:hypothetical protein
VAAANSLYVVADDETALAVYDFDGAPRARIPLLPGRLPDSHAERKRRKPDLEALCALPDGRLLALGSGSSAARQRGALVDPRLGGGARAVDLAPLYRTLSAEVRELNVEGAAVQGDRLVLLQRGNGPSRYNARIELDLPCVLASLEASSSLEDRALRGVRRVELGEIAGVPLGFTDAAPLPSGEILFTAVAEDTADTYADGPCAGAVVGVLAGAGVRSARCVVPVCKIEGVALRSGAGAEPQVWLVADPDDRRVRATLYRAPLVA